MSLIRGNAHDLLSQIPNAKGQLLHLDQVYFQLDVKTPKRRKTMSSNSWPTLAPGNDDF